MKMYSPKISKGLIPFLYQMAKRKGVPMTELVNSILEMSVRQDDKERLEFSRAKFNK